MDSQQPLESRDDVEPDVVETPEDLIAVAPYLLGYHLSVGDVFVAAFDAAEDLKLVLRVTARPPLSAATGEDITALWQRIHDTVRPHQAAWLCLVIYADAGAQSAARALVEASPIAVEMAVRVHAGRYWNLDCPGAGCDHTSCGPHGAPVADRPHLRAPYTDAGRTLYASHAELVADLRPGPGDVLAAVAAHLPPHTRWTLTTLYGQLRLAHTTRRHPDGPAHRPLTAQQAATLLYALADTDIRNACLTWTDDAGWRLWTELIRYAPPGWVAPIASVLAAVAYQRGDGPISQAATDLALADQPGYDLATDVAAARRSGIDPTHFHETAADRQAVARRHLRTRTQPRP